MAWIWIGLLLSGALLACDNSAESTSAKELSEKKTLRYDVDAPFTSLHPAADKVSGSSHIFPLLYSYLFVPNTDGGLDPDIAQRWTYSADKRQWAIHLRNNVRFHNQQQVTAADVKYSLELDLSRKRVQLMSVIGRITATSDKLLTISLLKDDPFILDKLWDIEIVPLPNKTIAYDPFQPIGSGPFKYGRQQGTQMVTLDANPHYYGGPPSIDRVVFYYQPDREKSWTRLLSGVTDIAKEITPQNYHIVSQYEDRFYFEAYAMRYYTILLFNLQDPLFSDLNVRKALSLGIDRDYIVRHILNGFGRPAAGPMGVDSPFHHPDVTPAPFDPAKAKALLYRSGWQPDTDGRLHKDGKLFDFTLFVFDESQTEKRVARFIQLCLNSIGIKVVVQAHNFEKIKDSYYQNTRFQAVLTELNGAYNRPGYIKRIWTTGGHGKSYAGCFDHPDVNRLMEKAFAANDPSKQKILLRELDRIITTLQPGTFLYQKTAINVMSRRFNLQHPFSLTSEGISRLKYLSINHEFNPLSVSP